MEIFQPIIDVFNFIVSILQIITEGITGIISILSSLFNLIISITKILPSPLYPCFLVFLTLFSTILIFKIVRKG